MDLHALRSPESGYDTFSGWCVNVCVCVLFIRKTPKQIIAETANLAFYICVICGYDLKNFMEIEKMVREHTKELESTTTYGQNFIFI